MVSPLGPQAPGMIHSQGNSGEAMQKIHEALLAGEAVVIFPEGEVAKSPHIGPFCLDWLRSAGEGTRSRSSSRSTIQGWGGLNDFQLFRTGLIIHGGVRRIPPVDLHLIPSTSIVREISIDAELFPQSSAKPIASSWLLGLQEVIRWT